MGQDKPGKHHPPSGKPSGVNKTEGLGVESTTPDKMDEYFEITDKYTADESETTSPAAPMTHPNRNTSKGETAVKAKEIRAELERSKSDSISENVTAKVVEIPGRLSRDTFLELAGYHAPHCISVYMETSVAGAEVNDGVDKLNFKNVMQELANMLRDKGADEIQIQKILRPGFELSQDNLFWKNLTPGLALFITDGLFRYCKLPMAPDNEVVCGTAFCVAPLIEILSHTEEFFLLTISKHKIRLFKGDFYGLTQIPVTGLPESIDIINDTAEKSSSLFRTGGRGGNGGANFHGIGGELDHKQEIASYFEMADDAIYKQVLHNQHQPLILAGVEYLIPLYRSVCDYKFISTEHITGNHDSTDVKTLHQLSTNLLKPYFMERRLKAIETYRNSINTDRVSSMPETVIAASTYGRVDTLFIKKGFHLWGRFNQNDGSFVWHDKQQPASEDLAGTAVRQTILNGGSVFLAGEGEMPWADAELAAIMRY